MANSDGAPAEPDRDPLAEGARSDSPGDTAGAPPQEQAPEGPLPEGQMSQGHVSPGSASGDELLTVGEIAERAGVHENTVRKYLRTDGVPFYLRDLSTGEIVSGALPQESWPSRYQYLLPAQVAAFIAAQAGDVVAPSQPTPTPSPTSTEFSARELTELRAQLSEAHLRLNASQQQLDSVRDERDWLRTHLDQITAALPPAQQEAQEQRARAEALAREREIERQQHELEDRAQELALQRFRALSWWKRLNTGNLDRLLAEARDELRTSR